MAKYIVEESDYKKYEKSAGMPLVNIIPAIVWSIPFHQKLFPDASTLVTFGLCALFVIIYVALGYHHFASIAIAIPSVIMLTAMFWVFADWIPNKIVMIIVKVIMAAFFGLIELMIIGNAMIPWLESKRKPNIRVIPD